MTTQPTAKKGDEKSRYRATLNLPQTAFPMKANLVQNEPASQKRWAKIGVYQKLRAQSAGKTTFNFHDGPPYANGGIHLGHLMNKTLKDLVVRSRGMMGLDCAYVPGWDCHGLPIEHKVQTELVEAGKFEKIKGLDEWQRKMAVRRECHKHAEKYIKLQMGQMQRLLTLADYEHPYLTMAPQYEASTLEVLGVLLERGLVYRALKPVHWSIANETALAEAELEYYDREDLSVYVDFEADDAAAVYDAFGLQDEENAEEEEGSGGGLNAEAAEDAELEKEEKGGPPKGRPGQRPTLMIWTTTPWTLPANLAIAVNPKFEYALVWVDGNVCVMAAEAVERVTMLARAERVEVLARTSGEKLVGLRYRHPFVGVNDGVRSPDFEAEKRGDASMRAQTLQQRSVPDDQRTHPPAPSLREGEVRPLSERGDTQRVFSILAADYVTLEDGTGLVHTAPGHGQEDYQTGLREGLPIYCPVRADGTYDATVPEWLRGLSVWDANAKVAKHLRDSGHLFFEQKFMHSYPHDWRSKTPTIFRCTEQWFVSVEKEFTVPDEGDRPTPTSLRRRALTAVSSFFGDDAVVRSDQLSDQQEERMFQGLVAFVPEWGRNRMRGMLESRPDWCISRQRSWGLPIPAFVLHDGSTFMTAATVRTVMALVKEKGSDAWFQLQPADLLAGYNASADNDASPAVKAAAASNWVGVKKGGDIIDVWFESGSSWNSVLRARNLGYPADLYLEGSDQHRGWFQASLLPALGVTGQPPYRTLLTHGFMVDKDGRKLSKSRTDAARYEVDSLTTEFGVDVMRWWVASLPYENDIKVDVDFFTLAGESYRKVRNTLRFMLSNLYDFEEKEETKRLRDEVGGGIDGWALDKFDELSRGVKAGYEAFDFKSAHAAMYDFCNETLSAVYLAAVKDRLYCDRADSARRRRTQAALFHITDGLCRLLAPIMPHTADEAYRALHRAGPESEACVHLEGFLAEREQGSTPLSETGGTPDTQWDAVLDLRAVALAELEKARQAAAPGANSKPAEPLDFWVWLPREVQGVDAVDLADLLGVSRVEFADTVRVEDRRAEPQCERSWKRDGTVKPRGDGGLLSDRDAEAVGVA